MEKSKNETASPDSPLFKKKFRHPVGRNLYHQDVPIASEGLSFPYKASQLP